MREFTRAIQCQTCKAHWYEPEDYESRQSCPYCGMNQKNDDLMLIGEDSEYFSTDGTYDPKPYDADSSQSRSDSDE